MPPNGPVCGLRSATGSSSQQGRIGAGGGGGGGTGGTERGVGHSLGVGKKLNKDLMIHSY